MSKEELLNKAMEIASKAHAGLTDKYGAPSIGHVMRVMNYGKTLDEKIVGALHDVIEDNSDYLFDTFRELGFPEHIIFAVECLTKKSENENYDGFLERTMQSPLAIAVKLNDLRDNMDLRRVNRELNAADVKRMNKYLRAYQLLINL